MRILILVFLISSIANADSVISCVDGDTCRIKTKNGIIDIRLSGIDAPESDQPFGSEAQKYLFDLLKDKDLTIQCNGKSFDRKVCTIFIGSLDVQKNLVAHGWALDFPKYSGGKYAKEQEAAEKLKFGIWNAKDIFSPYCWRWLGLPECNKNKLFQE